MGAIISCGVNGLGDVVEGTGAEGWVCGPEIGGVVCIGGVV